MYRNVIFKTSVMVYIHKGKVLDNGTICKGLEQTDITELEVQPEDDGLHIKDYNIGDFEWWYFDIIDQVLGFFLKIVMHIGTDPLKTRIFPQLAISVNVPELSESFTHPYRISDLEADPHQCRISVNNHIKIWTVFNNPSEYFIKIDIPQFKCDLRFTRDIEGWKPLGKQINHQIKKRKGSFSWTIPLPKASVKGDFFCKNKKYTLQNAIGYHDHNYLIINKNYPLHLDDLVIKWLWGKCYCDRFTVIFADILFKSGRILSLLVAENNKIIYSSNNLLDCSILSFGYDNILHAKYPTLLVIKSTDEYFNFQTEFKSDKISDRKDLLEGVNPVLMWLIKRLIAKPVYHGILTKVKIKINDIEAEGYGNIESMIFRERYTSLKYSVE